MALRYQADLLGYGLVSELVAFNSRSSALIFAPWCSKPTERDGHIPSYISFVPSCPVPLCKISDTQVSMRREEAQVFGRMVVRHLKGAPSQSLARGVCEMLRKSLVRGRLKERS